VDDTDDLKARIEALSPIGVRFLTRFVDSLGNPPVATPGTSWLNASPEWVEYFGLVISSHHGTTTEPLKTEGFEVGFRNACEGVEWEISPPGSATRRFVDVDVAADDGVLRRLSLKTTAARKLSESSLHISKLTEAAWIQDMRSTAHRRDRTVELFREYRAAVDAIVVLRAFRVRDEALPARYQLVEIPSEIFASIEAAPLAAFAADGPTIDCAYGGNPRAARVLLDRSDAKITVKQIQLSACTVHAVWELQPSSLPIT
jgi:Type II site-specific deoxyribonuclease